MAAEVRLGSSRGRWIVGSMVLGSTVTFLSATVVNVALPAIGTDLDAGLSGLQWVVNGYLLSLASLVLAGGSAGDLFGRRKVFVLGAVVFGVGAVLCALSPTLPALVGARLVQGIGAALLTPASLAIIDASFHPDDRSRAIGTWASGSALAASAGPLVGGYLVDALDWRWIFLVPLPMAAVAVVTALRHVPETRDETLGRHLDLVGSLLAMLTVAGVVFALVQGPVDGFGDPAVLSAAVTGGGGGLAFMVSQKRRRDPMVPLRLFSSRQFSGANVFTLLVYFAIGGAFFFTAIQFQAVLGYSALAAGAALVPLNLVMIVGSPRAGALSARYGPRWLVTAGPLLAAAGLAILSAVDAGDRYLAAILPGVLLLGAGLATMVGPLTASVFASVEERDVGIASAVNNAVARAGGLLATAFLPFAAGIGGNVDPASFAGGYRRALLISAGLCVISAAIGVATIGRCVAVHTSHQASPTSGCVQRSLPEQSAEAA